MRVSAAVEITGERVYSVVFRTNEQGGKFEVMNIVGERKTPSEIARDLFAAAKEIGLRGDGAAQD